MGFDIKQARKRVEISFEGTDWDGATVECYLSVPFGVSLRFAELASDAKDAQENFEQVVRLWLEHALVMWDFVADGEEIPATYEGFLLLDQDLGTLIISKWMEAYQEATTVSAPLDERSPNGVPSEVSGELAAKS